MLHRVPASRSVRAAVLIPYPSRAARSAPGPLSPILALVLLVTGAATAHASSPFSVSIGGGPFVHVDDDLREVYGTAGAFTIGMQPELREHHSRLRLELAYVTNSGRQIREDPTFELDENRYWMIPLSLGVETNTNPGSGPTGIPVWVGIHGVVAFTGWEDPLLGDFDAPVLGAAFELRPELPIARPVSFWTAYRVSALTDARYTGGADFQYSGSMLSAGLSYRRP